MTRKADQLAVRQRYIVGPSFLPDRQNPFLKALSVCLSRITAFASCSNRQPNSDGETFDPNE